MVYRIDLVVSESKVLIIANIASPIVAHGLHLDESLSESVGFIRVDLNLVPLASSQR